MLDNKQKILHRTAQVLTVIGLVLFALFMIYGIQKKIFTSEKALKDFLEPFGFWAPLIFVLVQAVQVIIPIIPGGVSCLAGVILFGPLVGFLCNYGGICLGSLAAFLIARYFGMELVQNMAKNKRNHKYLKWLDGDKFEKLFALAIFLPVAPDDFLCYLAGVTKMKIRNFIAIILLGKPLSIAAYSLGLKLIFNQIQLIFG